MLVQGAGDQFLAGAGLARNHDRQVGPHDAGENPIDLLHGGRSPDQRLALVGGQLGPQFRCRGDQALGLVEGALDDVGQLVEVERLGQVLEGTALVGLDRGHQCVLGADDDDP